MPRLATLIAVFLLALPGAAFAQGAGDDQYQDPFADEPAQQDDSGGGDGGLSDAPTVPGDGGGSGSGSSGSGSAGTGSTGSGSAGATGSASSAPAPAAGGDQLPNTGSDPRILILLGAAFVLTGAGLRLRTIDPDAY